MQINHNQTRGLYDSRFEHDACGVGLLVNVKGIKSHRLVEQGLQVLEHMVHRGAEGADPKTGDGAGIMVQVPHEFILLQGIPVPEKGRYGTGLVFMPKDEESQAMMLDVIEREALQLGLKLMAVRDVPSAREAITTFRVLERFEAGPKDDGYSLIECKLFTGRTHQIRVHMQYTRHPIVGDPVYNAHGPRDGRAQLGLGRQFLHSYSIGFEHPVTGEPLAFADQLPADLRKALDSLADRSLGVTEAGREVAALMETAPAPSVEGEVPRA